MTPVPIDLSNVSAEGVVDSRLVDVENFGHLKVSPELAGVHALPELERELWRQELAGVRGLRSLFEGDCAGGGVVFVTGALCRR